MLKQVNRHIVKDSIITLCDSFFSIKEQKDNGNRIIDIKLYIIESLENNIIKKVVSVIQTIENKCIFLK